MFNHREPAHECTGHPADHRPAAEFGGKSRPHSAYTRGHHRLIQIKPKAPEPGDFRVSFTYDYMGRRVRKITAVWCDGVSSDSPCDGQPEGWVADPDGDIRFIYDGWNVVMERRFNGTTEDVVHKFAWGADLSGLNGAAASGSASAAVHGAGGIGGLLAVEEHDPGYVFTEPAKYLYFYDGNGNVGQVVTLDIGVFGEQPGVPPSNEGWYPAVLLGQIAARYEYDPYGGTLVASQDGWMTNPFRFSTKYYDAQPATAAAGERGLYYYGYRYYSPRMGRWISFDPAGESDGACLYAFVHNSPLRFVDPNGDLSLDIAFTLGLMAKRASCLLVIDTYEEVLSGVINGRPDAALAIFDLASMDQFDQLSSKDKLSLGIFQNTQSCILKELPSCSSCLGKFDESDSKWITRVTRDFMRPYVASLCERASGLTVTDLGWRDFYNRLDTGKIQQTVVPPVARQLEIARQMALNHIRNDLRSSLIKNGKGYNFVWKCIGNVVDSCQRRAIHGFFQPGADAAAKIWEDYDIQSIRDRMRDNIKKREPILP